MIWNLLVVFAVVVILVIIARRLPDTRKKLVESSPEVSNKEINFYGLVAQADDAFDNKDFKKAESLYIKAVSEDPDNAKIYSRLGAIYLEQGNYYDGRDSFKQAVKLEPNLASRHVNLGLAYMGLKDYFKTIESFKKALSLDKKNKKYQKLLEKAEKLYQKEKKKVSSNGKR